MALSGGQGAIRYMRFESSHYIFKHRISSHLKRFALIRWAFVFVLEITPINVEGVIMHQLESAFVFVLLVYGNHHILSHGHVEVGLVILILLRVCSKLYLGDQGLEVLNNDLSLIFYLSQTVHEKVFLVGSHLADGINSLGDCALNMLLYLLLFS